MLINKFNMKYRSCFICNNKFGKIFVKKKINVISAGNFSLGFKVCNKCGFVYQSPIVPKRKMERYYKFIADYINSGNEGKPKDFKIDTVKKQKRFVLKFLKKNSKILQIGSSDGYTLSQFKTKHNHVTGVEPSVYSCKFAKKKYKIDKIVPKTFENSYKKLGKFNLIILSHVLEHIYDPEKMLNLLSTKLEDNGVILIEVPFLSDARYLGPSYFTFEHLNYFDKESMKNLLIKTNFEIVDNKFFIDLKYKIYPIQRMVIKKKNDYKLIYDEYIFKKKKLVKKNYNIMKKFEKKEGFIFQKMMKKILKETNNDKFAVWGAGIHSSYFFSTNKKILNNISFFVDGDKKKWGKKIYNKRVISPKKFIKLKKPKYLVTSTISEKEINKFLMSKNYKNKIINLYN